MSGMKIAYFLSHPIQYKTPLLRRLAANPAVSRLKAFFYSDTGLTVKRDSYLGYTDKWDVPLLDGYDYEFLGRRRFSKLGRTYFNPGVIKRVFAEKWDAVLISSYTYISDWFVLFAAKIRRIPVLFFGDMYPRAYTSNIRARFAGLIKKVMLKNCAACLAIGRAATQEYHALGLPDDMVFLAPYAVDNDYFLLQASRLRPMQASLKEDAGVVADTVVILCVAGMLPVKRQVDLVEAVARLDAKVKLVLVGHGPLLDDVRAFCRHRLPDTLVAGFKNQTELPRYYAMADIFVLPSLSEVFGLVVNEAMCFELPIITSETVAASQDLIVDDENGYTFPPGNIDSLTACLKTLVFDREKRLRFGRRSLEIIQGWNYDQTINGILRAIESARQLLN